MLPARTVLILFISMLCCMLLDITHGIHTFDVYRMIQYDKGNVPFGSQRSTFALQATSISSADFARKLVVVHFDKLKLSELDEVFNKAGGLLILLPPKEVKLNDDVMRRWTEIERELVNKEVRIPVYFAPMDEQLEEVYQASKSDSNQDEAASNSLLGSLWSDQYTLVATASEPAPIKGTALTNIQVQNLPFVLLYHITPTINLQCK